MKLLSFLPLMLAIGCTSSPPSRVESGRTIEVVFEELPDWPAGPMLRDIEAVESTMRRLDLQAFHVKALATEKLEPSWGGYTIDDHRISGILGTFHAWTSEWSVDHQGAPRKARTEITVVSQPRRTMQIDIRIASWHPRTPAPNFPRTLLETLQQSLLDELPRALKEAGVRARVHYAESKPTDR